MPRLCLKLYKENFKFSAAHFLIFNEQKAERLHGHNYRVQIELTVSTQNGLGYSIDFGILKSQILPLLEELDEYVLLPALHPDIQTRVEGATLHLRFRERVYAFPANEVKLLPLKNTSVEEYARFLAEQLKDRLHEHSLLKIQVTVEETSGQAAQFLLDC